MPNLRPQPVKFVADPQYPAAPLQQPIPLYVIGGLANVLATTTVAGAVKQIPNIAAFSGGTDTTTQTNLNTLRTALVTAGIMVGP